MGSHYLKFLYITPLLKSNFCQLKMILWKLTGFPRIWISHFALIIWIPFWINVENNIYCRFLLCWHSVHSWYGIFFLATKVVVLLYRFKRSFSMRRTSLFSGRATRGPFPMMFEIVSVMFGLESYFCLNQSTGNTELLWSHCPALFQLLLSIFVKFSNMIAEFSFGSFQLSCLLNKHLGGSSNQLSSTRTACQWGMSCILQLREVTEAC